MFIHFGVFATILPGRWTMLKAMAQGGARTHHAANIASEALGPLVIH
jgi:hypothetical protein